MREKLDKLKVTKVTDNGLSNEDINTTTNRSEEVVEEINIITGVEDAAATPLPEGVTAEPRNEEEMHINLIREWPNAVQVYLKVSDDAGEVLGSKVLERKVKTFCDQYADPKAEIKDPAKVIEDAKELATNYILQINMVESGLIGTTTKYRIRGGMVFIILKRMVKATKGPKWIEWFKEHFDGREFRSIQDYMRLAKIPGIIRYAVFGKERLLEILRQLSEADKQTDDPIDVFITRNGINFNPTQEVDLQELRIETDIAISYGKLIKEDLDIPKAMVEVLVRNGKEVESAHVRELKVAKDDRQDIVAQFEEIIAADGRVEPVMTPDRKAEGFKKKSDQFIKAMKSAISDVEYRGQINAELINSLKETLQQLEEALQATT